jgi:hypothetical protein
MEKESRPSHRFNLNLGEFKMFGAPTLGEICKQETFNTQNVDWLKPSNATNLSKYNRIPVDKFLQALRLLGVDTACWDKCTSTSSVLYAQLDNPMAGCDAMFQKVLDFLS